MFETNIRYVGGLLSAFSLTGDDIFREKATHVADKLTPAFKSPTGIPYALINMRTGVSFFSLTKNESEIDLKCNKNETKMYQNGPNMD